MLAVVPQAAHRTLRCLHDRHGTREFQRHWQGATHQTVEILIGPACALCQCSDVLLELASGQHGRQTSVWLRVLMFGHLTARSFNGDAAHDDTSHFPPQACILHRIQRARASAGPACCGDWTEGIRSTPVTLKHLHCVSEQLCMFDMAAVTRSSHRLRWNKL